MVRKKKKQKDASNFQLKMGIFISAIMIVFYIYYKNEISITENSYYVAVKDLNNKKEVIYFTIPYLNSHLHAYISSNDAMCLNYLKNREIDIVLKAGTTYKKLNEYRIFDLYGLRRGERVAIEFSSNKKLSPCNISINLSDIALDTFLFIVFGYIPTGLIILSFFILLMRYLKALKKGSVATLNKTQQ